MTTIPLGAGATPLLGEILGRSVVRSYVDTGTEYAALRSGALLIDRSERGRMRVDGPKAAELITGLVTNDVKSLAPGTGQYAAALSPKGKIVADVRIFADDAGLFIDTPPRAAEGWSAMVRKYVNPRMAPYSDHTGLARDMGVFGVAGRRITSAVTGVSAEALAALPVYGHLAVEVGGMPATVARVPDLGVEGYEVFVPPDAFDGVWSAAVAAGATAGGLDAWEIARIEAGRPEWGLDMDDTTMPQEANFDELGAISYTKGCYVGQEVVARIHFRGHVNKHLRGLVCVEGEGAPQKAVLFDDTGKQVGEVRSSAVSPRLRTVALAMVRREVPTGATLSARWDGGEARCEVTQLPFPI